MDPQRFVQCPVERSAVVAKLLPQCLLGLGAGEVGRWRVAALPLRLRMRRGAVQCWDNPT
jgi:hypothetical protein